MPYSNGSRNVRYIAGSLLLLIIAFATPAAQAQIRAGSAARSVIRAAAPGRQAAPGGRKIDYARDIQPILASHCGACHLNGARQGDFQLSSRETILKGGVLGSAVSVGKSGTSLLIRLVSGANPGSVMPPQGPRLSATEVGLLRSWIDQGLSFGLQGAAWQPVLQPRRPALPALPAGVREMNPIDRLLLPYFRTHRLQPKPVVSDRVYARRVYLDVTGLLPTPEELAAFVQDRQPDKRERLADRLLSDNRNYAVNWLTFWNDALRNDYAGAGYIDGGRKPITQWLYNALLTDMPYDRFVKELVSPVPGSEGFVKGIVWRGTVNASQTPEMQAAQNISQVFLGINLKCASCHDSFISQWKLSDSYGMAGIYADHPLEMVRCDRPMGKMAPVKFLYPELGAIDPQAPRSDRLDRLAQILTSEQDGRLSRTIVNRLWARLMGRGLVEPVDEMDNRPWDPDLLDWLAIDLADNRYDLKKTLRLILTSRAYQLPAVGMSEGRTPNYVFSGPTVRRMSAEQFVDAVRSLTDVWPRLPDANLGGPARAVQAKWIWSRAGAAQAAPGARVYFRKALSLPAKPSRAIAVISCDNEFTLAVNGKTVIHSEDWQNPSAVDLTPYLTIGDNTLSVEAINWPDPVTGKGSSVANGPNPAGFIFFARIIGSAPRDGSAAPRWDMGSDSSWLCSEARVDHWEMAGATLPDAKPAVELGPASVGPWMLETKLAANLEAAAGAGEEPRSALMKSNPLTTALGRPNREQVVTSRSSAATTLQALELTNGRTLASILHEGAQNWMTGKLSGTQTVSADATSSTGTGSPTSASRLVNLIFQRSMGRYPTPAELQGALGLLGSPVREEGVEDLLWTLTMLPEFQLIH